MASKYIFPAGIRNPDYPLDEQLADPTLRSEYEDGSQQTRPKFTRIRKIFAVEWNSLPDTEKELLVDFYCNTVKAGAEAFDWTDPVSGKLYAVRFGSAPKIKAKMLHYYTVSITLNEV